MHFQRDKSVNIFLFAFWKWLQYKEKSFLDENSKNKIPFLSRPSFRRDLVCRKKNLKKKELPSKLKELFPMRVDFF